MTKKINLKELKKADISKQVRDDVEAKLKKDKTPELTDSQKVDIAIQNEQRRIVQGQIKAMLILKTALEHNTSIITLTAKVVNAASNDKAIREGKLEEQIKRANAEYIKKVTDIAESDIKTK